MQSSLNLDFNNYCAKVRQLIKGLQKYDSDREIYILYDGCYHVKPELEELTDSDIVGLVEDVFHAGDLVIKS